MHYNNDSTTRATIAQDETANGLGHTESGQSPGERLARLFHGNELEAWGSYVYPGGRDQDGKKLKTSVTHEPAATAGPKPKNLPADVPTPKDLSIDRPMTSKDWHDHIEGKVRIGCCPIIDRVKNYCLFGALDIDSASKVDVAALARRIADTPDCPLVVTVSPSKGAAHVYLFAESPVPAHLMRANLQYWRAQFGFPGDTEVYPKKDTLPPELLGTDGRVHCGHWLSHPYFGDETYAVNGDMSPAAGSQILTGEVMDYLEGKRLNAAQFYDHVEQACAETETKKKKFVLPDRICKGETNTTLTAYAGQLQRQGVPDGEMRELVNKANDERCDAPQPASGIAHILEQVMKYPKGEPKKAKFFIDDDDQKLHATTWKMVGDKFVPKDVVVSSFIEIIGEARDVNDLGWSRAVRIKDHFGKQHEFLVPRSIIKTTDFDKFMSDRGVWISPKGDALKLLKEFLGSESTGDKIRLVRETGWHDDVYCLPGSNFGDGPENIMLEAAPSENVFQTGGTYEKWRVMSKKLVVNNSRLVFAVSAAFAGPMLRFTNIASNPGYNLAGISSGGKTTVLHVAGSVCGGSDRSEGYLCSWKLTVNGMERVAAMHNDGLLCLDELRQLDARQIGDVIYMLGNGGGRNRMNRNLALAAPLHWQLITLSSGEVTTATYAQEGGKRLQGGQAVRMIDIPAVPAGGYGVFEDIHKFPTGQAFADHLKRTARENYGWALQDFLVKLTKDAAGIGEQYKWFVTKITRELMQDHQGASSEISRVAESFAVIAAAGEIATQQGITQWPEQHATWAAKVCFAAWLDGRAGTSQGTDEAQALGFVRLLIEQHGSSRFEGLTLDAYPARDRLGYRWYEDGKTEDDRRCIYLFTPEAFRQECAARGFQMDHVVKILKQHGWLQLGEKRGLIYRKSIRGQRVAGYAVRLPDEPAEIQVGDQMNLEAA